MARRKGTRPAIPKAEVVASIALTDHLSDPEGAVFPEFPGVDIDAVHEQRLDIPKDWNLGALLNVRNHGEHYAVTLYPEEADWRHPERTLRFTNVGKCQQFISEWYSRTFHDPRA
jgi:hypothetical protein